MTLLWEISPNAADTYRIVLGDGIEHHTTAARLSRALQEGGHQLVLIGPDVPLAEACQLAQRERLLRPELGVILIRQRLEVTSLSEALRSGMREVVQTGDHTALADAIARSRALSSHLSGPSEAPTNKGKVVTVFSAKGGVGKTTVATNLSTHLASSGCRTLLIDLDLMFGDVAISLQRDPGGSIGDLIPMLGHVDTEALSSVVEQQPSSSLDILAAPDDPSVADRVPSELIPELLRVARSQYEYIIIDTPPAFTEHVLAAIDESDLLLLIATLDIPALKNLKVAITTLDALGGDPESRALVLNRADTKVGLTPQDVEQVLGIPIAVSVPYDMEVPASTNRGVPIVVDKPRGTVAASLRTIADAHIRKYVVDEDRELKVKPTHRRALISGWRR
ncbi:MAG TPA: AAA family ATPase [Marmoricola sp.]|nr:AAA family ATPase [Marmoricola sp.]HNO40548.1 AAA family ATPase [Marmoricola sp.]